MFFSELNSVKSISLLSVPTREAIQIYNSVPRRANGSQVFDFKVGGRNSLRHYQFDSLTMVRHFRI